MGGYGGRLLLVVVLLFSACTGGNEPAATPTPTPTEDPELVFIRSVDDLCEPFGKADRALTASDGRRQAARRLDQAIDAQEDLLRGARKLEPVAAVARPFKAYLKLLKQATNLRHRVVLESEKLARAVEEDLQLAKTEDRLDELTRKLRLSSACPPIEAQFIEFRLFTAKTNKACFGLYQKIKKVEVFKQELTSRTTARAGLVSLLDFQERVGDAIRAQRPKDLEDERIDKLLKLNKDRAAVIGELIADFDNFDQAAYEADYKRYRDLWTKIRKVSDDLNVEACSYVVPKT